MAKKAYRIMINPNGKDGIHSISPSWVLTFVRWKNRYFGIDNTNSASNSKDVGADNNFLATLPPMIVDNDCASLSITVSKSSNTPSLQALLYPGDINYLTAVAPGDFVFVNILNHESEARNIYFLAKSLKPINTKDSGFKGLFKIQSVRRILGVDPASGRKKVMFQITGYGFTEFNNIVYFNPFLVSKEDTGPKGFTLFVSRISDQWRQALLNENKKGIPSVQRVIKLLIDTVIGKGFNKELTTFKDGQKMTQNTHFYIPKEVGQLLGFPSAKAAKDIYNYIFGVQEYTVPSQNSNPPLEKVLNPIIKSKQENYFFTPREVQGAALIKPEYWSEIPLWSILGQYLNSPINEIFNSFKINPDGLIVPTVTLRQIPYSTEKFKGLSTKFFNLPRWVISPDFLLDINIGRDDALRFNFFQLFSTVPFAPDASNVAFLSTQIKDNNLAEILDIRRSGLRPYIKRSDFDEIISGKEIVKNSEWVRLLADANTGGHLKFTGSITCFGIQEPIAPGDNLELDDVVYQIQTVTHNCSIQPDGKKTFVTSIELVNGLDVQSEDGDIVFPQMRNTDMQKELEENRETSFTLPGISDEQAIVGREGENQGINTTINNSFPSLPNKPVKSRRKK